VPGVPRQNSRVDPFVVSALADAAPAVPRTARQRRRGLLQVAAASAPGAAPRAAAPAGGAAARQTTGALGRDGARCRRPVVAGASIERGGRLRVVCKPRARARVWQLAILAVTHHSWYRIVAFSKPIVGNFLA
jgi:hypothetical protein